VDRCDRVHRRFGGGQDGEEYDCLLHEGGGNRHCVVRRCSGADRGHAEGVRYRAECAVALIVMPVEGGGLAPEPARVLLTYGK